MFNANQALDNMWWYDKASACSGHVENEVVDKCYTLAFRPLKCAAAEASAHISGHFADRLDLTRLRKCIIDQTLASPTPTIGLIRLLTQTRV